MVFFPNAKINIGLRVLNDRGDGFHNIETVIYPAGLTDILEFIEQPPSIKTNQIFSATGIPVGTDPDENLCVKAFYLIKQDFKLPPVFIHLHKMIPVGAGLGGGSADAAFMIKYLNQYFKLNMTREQMTGYALQLGSDCPFFILNQPVLATGKGEQMQFLSLNLKGMFLVIVKPDIVVSTAEAYKNVNYSNPSVSLKELVTLPLHQWKSNIENDFEKSIFSEYPVIGKIKADLYENGAAFASMSGSGSAVFGLFELNTSLKLKFPGCFVWEGYL